MLFSLWVLCKSKFRVLLQKPSLWILLIIFYGIIPANKTSAKKPFRTYTGNSLSTKSLNNTVQSDSNFLFNTNNSQGIKSPNSLLNQNQKANGMLISMGAPTVINLQFELGADGKLDPDNNNNPGNDSVTASSSGTTVNGIVRTHDIMAYQWNYAIPNTGAVAENVVLTATLDSDLASGKPGQEWVEIPNFCQAGSSISGVNNETITCILGDIDATNQAIGGILQVEARVLGDTPHGTQVSATGSISADNRDAASTTDPGPVSATVSAAPKFDLRKTDGSPTNIGVFDNPSGQRGFVYRYKLAVLVDNGGVGSEPLDPNQNITIIDDLSQHAPNAVLYDWGTQPACAPNGTNNIRDNNIPYGKVGIRSGSDATNSVTDSGTWACSQSGDEISIQITGADTTGNKAPQFKSNGGSLPVTERHVIAGYIHIWVPESDVSGSLTVTNSYQFLTAQGISGTANTEPDAGNNSNNNSETHTILTGSGSFNQYYRDADNSNRFTPLSLTEQNAGNGVVMPGQVFIKWLNAFNNGSTDWENAIYCDKIDNRTQTVTNYPGETDPVQIERIPSGWVEGADFVIEYGTGDENGNPGSFSSNYTNQRNATCDDADSATPWTTDFSSLNAEDVTRVRFRALKPVPSRQRIRFRIGLTARNTFVDNGAQIPVGELLVNHSAIYADNLNGGTWDVRNYNPVNHSGSKAFGDRLFLTRAIVRIEKVNLADPSQEVNSADPLDQVTFELRPTVTSQIENSTPTSDDVIVEDTLPAELTYIDGSASIPPTSVESISGGGTKITWNLGQRVPDVAITPITFKAEVGFDVANNATITNTVIISSDADATPEASRTDTTSLSITNLAAYTISKSTSTPLINPNEEIKFTISYANTGNTNFNNPSTIVDVFPYIGDGRVVTDAPESDYNGALTLQLPSEPGANGETFEYTNVAPASVDTNPDPGANTTTWCKEADFGNGGCPSSANDVTAIRITTLPFPKGEPTRNLTLRFSTNSNTRGNVYANNFTLHNSKLVSNLISQNVQVLVPLMADLELAKIVDNAAPKVGNQVKFTITVNNQGPNNTTGVEVKDVLPTSLTYVSDNPDTGSFNSSTGTWTIGNLANGATANLEIVATVNTDGSITNTAQVSASGIRDPDSTPNNNNASEDDQAAASLTAAVASDPNVLLVKRITAINGDRTKNPNDNTPLNTFVDDTTSSQKDNDNHSNWPSGYLLGELDAGKVKPGDEIEYTIYFLNAGDRNANDVRICDRITPNQDFQVDTYGTGKGIQLKLGTSTAIDLTNTNDTSDRAELIAANSAVPSSCNLQATNDNGTLVIDITGSSNTIQPDLTTMPGSTGQGAPNDSYGFIRFVTKVKP